VFGGDLFCKRTPKKALYFLNSYLHQNPSDLSARLTLAKIWNQLGKFSSARKELNRILKTKKIFLLWNIFLRKCIL
ncbi:hypothetical protein LEP1GSC150_3825, partial [Leptospira interrogans serovar Copenhageni str. LT2050]